MMRAILCSFIPNWFKLIFLSLLPCPGSFTRTVYERRTQTCVVPNSICRLFPPITGFSPLTHAHKHSAPLSTNVNIALTRLQSYDDHRVQLINLLFNSKPEPNQFLKMLSLEQSQSLLRNVLGDEQLARAIHNAKLLLVGCGGIGCEVIKNLMLIGFQDVTMIDLDTIDVSNLNRQFLFNKSHINQGKAQVSSSVARTLFAHTDSVKLQPIHGSIQSQDYNVDFFRQFTMVVNALDNRQARTHVNRMCLAADVPLIESGSEGYLGQTFVIKKNVSMCYECEGPKQDVRTFASCTIRNTPSLPIHCIVWAKHLFAQLFGEEDADNDVSPDMNDPELSERADNKENGECLFCCRLTNI